MDHIQNLVWCCIAVLGVASLDRYSLELVLTNDFCDLRIYKPVTYLMFCPTITKTNTTTTILQLLRLLWYLIIKYYYFIFFHEHHFSFYSRVIKSNDKQSQKSINSLSSEILAIAVILPALAACREIF